MTNLKSLTFSALTGGQSDPSVVRRAKLVGRLEHQRALALDPLYLRTEHRWVIQDNGIKERVELKKRVRPWWRVDDLGNVYLTVRYGSKALELEKGKKAILLTDKSKLVGALDTLIAATKAGELDAQLSSYAKERKIPKTRRAA